MTIVKKLKISSHHTQKKIAIKGMCFVYFFPQVTQISKSLKERSRNLMKAEKRFSNFPPSSRKDPSTELIPSKLFKSKKRNTIFLPYFFLNYRDVHILWDNCNFLWFQSFFNI